MRKSLLLVALVAGASLAQVKPSDIDGAWVGNIEVGETKIKTVLHLTTTQDGLAATLDSPDQGAMGIPVAAAKRDGASLTLDVAAVAGRYEAKISANLQTIEGTWKQSGGSFPLVLKRAEGGVVAGPKRLQMPVKPYPYREEELTYQNKQGGIQLAATLTIPQGKGPFQAVALIAGSGPNDRDESLMGHKPFLVLADYLTRKGIAVLRTDKRGIGKSGGTIATATTADFATDAEAAVAYLKTRPEVDSHKIGLIGHSEGGVIAPMVAARNHDVAFIVMMAGPGVPGDQIIVAQVVEGNEAAGMSHEMAQQAGVQQRKILDIVEQETDDAVRREKLHAVLGPAVTGAQFDTVYRQLTSPWYLYFLTYDPAPALRKVTCPVLAIIGERDSQVPSKLNLPVIRKALEDGGNKHFEVVELQGLNHVLQTAKTGAVSEYAQIEETIAPKALEKMASWILKQ
jgi:pimeloyl-ACP methyl ester carboxylesterase